MYAVIETGGKQYRVAPGDSILVEKLEGEPGTAVEFDKVLAIGNDEGQLTTGGAVAVDELGNPIGDSSDELALGGASAQSTVLAGRSGWGDSQALVVLATVLPLALVMAPPILWRRLGGAAGPRSPGGGA